MTKIHEISLKTTRPVEFIDITERIVSFVTDIEHGIVHIYCPHTTAGLTINENADPNVVRDIIRGLERMVPKEGDYSHAEGNSPAHIKASLMGFHQEVFIDHGKLVLGTWQGIYFCEFDGPRSRKIITKIEG
jgi:secondary thiamine-phosphate synthase enzyme